MWGPKTQLSHNRMEGPTSEPPVSQYEVVPGWGGDMILMCPIPHPRDRAQCRSQARKEQQMACMAVSPPPHAFS